MIGKFPILKIWLIFAQCSCIFASVQCFEGVVSGCEAICGRCSRGVWHGSFYAVMWAHWTFKWCNWCSKVNFNFIYFIYFMNIFSSKIIVVAFMLGRPSEGGCSGRNMTLKVTELLNRLWSSSEWKSFVRPRIVYLNIILTLVLASADCAAHVLGADSASFSMEGLWSMPEAPCTHSSGSSINAKTGSAPPTSQPRRRGILGTQSSTSTQVAENSIGPSATGAATSQLPHYSSPPAMEVACRGTSVTPNFTWRAGPPNITDIIDTFQNHELLPTRAFSMEPLGSEKVLPLPSFIPAGFFPRPLPFTSNHLTGLLACHLTLPMRAISCHLLQKTCKTYQVTTIKKSNTVY